MQFYKRRNQFRCWNLKFLERRQPSDNQGWQTARLVGLAESSNGRSHTVGSLAAGSLYGGAVGGAGKVAYGHLCDLSGKAGCDLIKRSLRCSCDLCDVVSRLCQSGCGPFAKALSKALQSESRLHCRFSKRPTPCKGKVKMVISHETRFQNFGSPATSGRAVSLCAQCDFNASAGIRGRRVDSLEFLNRIFREQCRCSGKVECFRP